MIGSLIYKHVSAAALPVIVDVNIILLASAGYVATLAPLTICSLMRPYTECISSTQTSKAQITLTLLGANSGIISMVNS